MSNELEPLLHDSGALIAGAKASYHDDVVLINGTEVIINEVTVKIDYVKENS